MKKVMVLCGVQLALAGLLSAAAPAALAGKANDTLTWATPVELDSADFYYQNVREAVILTQQVCDSLLHRNIRTQEYEPLLATGYQWVNDLTLDVTLRKGVSFHDGRPFTADDVVYTFTHTSNPKNAIATPFTANWVKSVEALAPDKVRFHLHKPTPAALEYLSGVTPIYPKGHYDKAPTVTGPGGTTRRDWGALVPICTGPYKIAQFTPGKTVVMERNPNYFKGGPKGTPKIGKLVFRTITDTQTQMAELMTGGVDWIWTLPKDDADRVGKSGRITVKAGPTLRINALAFDAAGRAGPSPFNDVRVRRAVNHAIDKAAMAKALVGPDARVLFTACYPTQKGCTDDGAPRYPYDPAKAKALLAEAGFPNGFQAELLSYRDRTFAEAIIGYLRAVGIRVDLRYVQYAPWKTVYQDGKSPFTHLSWGSAGIDDASASVSAFFKHQSDDYAMDKEVKEWLDKADSSIDPKVRDEFYRKALLKIADQAYWAPLFSHVRYYAYNSELDFTPTADEVAPFYSSSWR